ncbi:hypothetical protein PENSPDRAFT_33419 [Peniophora sp. CONT]|nr:hypothetical protein PENSPDRAFT_33419 [Peniophora sp. CONT]
MCRASSPRCPRIRAKVSLPPFLTLFARISKILETATPVPESERSISREQAPASAQEQIFVKTFQGQTLTFYVDLGISTVAFHAQVAMRTAGLNRGDRWCLSHAYSGVKLLPERTLLGNKVQKESTLQMVPRYGSAGWWPLDPTGILAHVKAT